MTYASIHGYKFAMIGDTIQVESQKQPDVYHGTSLVSKDVCISQSGLPRKGSDIDLIRHVEPPRSREHESAFIGTVSYPVSPAFDDSGAAVWAGEGGWVYHIQDWRGYDVNSLLEGRVPDGKGGFRGPLMCGENEIAIPAMVPIKHIARIGKVVSRRGGLVVRWGVE